jgi:phage host-nuclease inhibitor protein Gam
MNMLQRAIHRISDVLTGDDATSHKDQIKQANREAKEAVEVQRDLNRWQGDVIKEIRELVNTKPDTRYLIEDTYFPNTHPLSRRRSR